ncbi:RagB/SusD family nutrient uptake outer membrane protein [Chitinophaga varians]|uniref:RagB/SusD family nutrient uptake outer membrane protein n=1 Tax=Chitinophaga varians TaxID=2202339 RepID=UPI00165F49D4|nr:RagB/SusD family nutrient uptake outer membrane protein [Chitinophaga varians]MBC9912958.1 RagB/SusD family nutrient uptake outer membrane protein [Chitinophaga varians]
MNKKYIFHIAVAGSMLFTSCSKNLDDVQPNTQVTFDQINRSNLPLVVNGAKLALTNNALYQIYGLQDIMGDDFQSISYLTYEGNNVPSTDNSLTFAYKQPYQCVANANMAINFAVQQPAGDSLITVNLGEAYLLRAYSYMLLTEMFGDVVIIKGGENPKGHPVRNPVAEVQQFIEADLKAAAIQLPDYNGKSLTGSKQAAQLLLARLYLNLGRNDEALAMANAVISSNRLTLQSNFGDIFKSGTTSPEALYRINEMSNVGSALYGLGQLFGPGKYGGTPRAGTGNTWVDSTLLKTYDASDIRRAFFLKNKGAAILDSVYFVTKFPEETTPSYPICRYSEAFLVVAEANARKGVVDVTAYNQLRAARKASLRNNSDFANTAAFLAEIEMERRREFVGERLRWSDMQRFGKMNAWLQSFGQPASHVLLPIPTHEFALNPNLTQNADYSK